MKKAIQVLSIVFLFYATIAHAGAGLNTENECTIAKSVSIDKKSGKKIYGNAFALSKTEFVLNDHSLTTDAQEISLYINESVLLTGKIIKRDFHTDLALVSVKMNNSVVVGCTLDLQLPNANRFTVEVRGFDATDVEPFILRSEIVNKASQKLEVPGILTSIEIGNSKGEIAIRKSMSGSPVFGQKGVIGIVTQLTKEGTALLIPARDIRHIAEQMKSRTLPKRPYTYNSDSQTFYFQGLELRGSDQKDNLEKSESSDLSEPVGSGGDKIAGDPHEGHKKEPKEAVVSRDGGIYGNDGNEFVSLEELEFGHVVAHVANYSTLAKSQPLIAKMLPRSSSKTIFIQSVDGVEVKNLFQLVRTLGVCTACRIDNFWVKTENPKDLSDRFLQASGYLLQLMDSFGIKGEQPKAVSISAIASQMNRELISLSRELDIYGSLSRQQLEKVQGLLEQIHNKLAEFYLTDPQRDLLFEIQRCLIVPNL